MNLCLRQPEYNEYGDGDGLLGEELNIHDEVKLAAKMGKKLLRIQQKNHSTSKHSILKYNQKVNTIPSIYVYMYKYWMNSVNLLVKEYIYM